MKGKRTGQRDLYYARVYKYLSAYSVEMAIKWALDEGGGGFRERIEGINKRVDREDVHGDVERAAMLRAHYMYLVYTFAANSDPRYGLETTKLIDRVVDAESNMYNLWVETSGRGMEVDLGAGMVR